LAVETRAAGAGWDACAALDHAATHSAVAAERAFLRALGGGCQVPIGAAATVNGAKLHLVGLVIAPDGSAVVRGERAGTAADAETVGATLGAKLLADGARAILETTFE